MKYLLIPVKDSGSSNDYEAMGPGLLMNLITGIILSFFITQYFPTLHGWARFGVCISFAIIYTVLSLLPYIGPVLCVITAIIWILFFWALAIKTVWLKWLVRIMSTLLIIMFESVLILSSIS